MAKNSGMHYLEGGRAECSACAPTNHAMAGFPTFDVMNRPWTFAF